MLGLGKRTPRSQGSGTGRRGDPECFFYEAAVFSFFILSLKGGFLLSGLRGEQGTNFGGEGAGLVTCGAAEMAAVPTRATAREKVNAPGLRRGINSFWRLIFGVSDFRAENSPS